VKLQGLFKNHLLAVGLLIMGIGFAIIAMIPALIPILIGVCFVGFGQGILFPLINVKVLGNVEPSISDKVISIVSSMIYVGQFISPVVLEFVGNLVSMPTIRFQYSALAGGLIISVIVMYIYKTIRKSNLETVS